MTLPLAAALAHRPAPLGHHVTLALEGRLLLADDAPGRRLLARVVYHHLEGRGLVGFGAADDHLHLLLACDRVTCGPLVRRLAIALRKRLGHAVPFEPSRYRPIETSRHERNTYLYGFRQEERHGTSIDPLFDASSLPDRIGARVLLTRAREPIDALLARGGWTIAAPSTSSGVTARRRGDGVDDRDLPVPKAGGEPVLRGRTSGRRVHILGASTSALARRRMPRLHDDELLELVGGPRLLEVPLALELLADAAAAAVGLGALDGLDPPTILARRAAVHLALTTTTPREVAHLLRLPRRTVQRDASAPTARSVARAVELQLRMRSRGTLGGT